MKNFSVDIQLIIQCCTFNVDSNKIKPLIQQIKNWEVFIDLAFSHGVFPLVYKELKKYRSLIPQEIFHIMKIYNINIVKQNMLMSAELIKVMQILEENNIEALAFKGPTLAQMAYGDITLRQYGDLDILVQKDDIYKVYDLLKGSYSRELECTPAQEKTWFKYAHDLGLTAKNGTHIEFHWSMLDNDHPINLKNIDFFQNKTFVDINKQNISVISNEEFLIYLCVHGSKHMFERIEWVVDIDKFICTQKINWSHIEKILQNKNYKNFVFLGLFLAQKLFNTPISQKIHSKTDTIEIISHYIQNIWNEHKEATNSTNIQYTLKLFTSIKDKIKFIYKMYFKPTFTEYWYISLPDYLYFLYYPLRQYLLIKKYLFKSSN